MEKQSKVDFIREEGVAHATWGQTSTGSSSDKERTQKQSGAKEMPSLLICSPSRAEYVSRGFTHSLRNMFVPFPDNHYDPVQGRHIADARNAAVYAAITNDFTLHMQVDEDQRFPWDFFLNLYEGIKQYGENTIVTGWAICKSGIFGGKPCVFRKDGGEVVAISEAELQASPEYIEIDSFGTCGFMAPTSVFKQLEPPWFADVNILHPPRDGDNGLHVGTSFVVGQDVFMSNRLREAGTKIICSTKSRMPHEFMSVL